MALDATENGAVASSTSAAGPDRLRRRPESVKMDPDAAPRMEEHLAALGRHHPDPSTPAPAARFGSLQRRWAARVGRLAGPWERGRPVRATMRLTAREHPAAVKRYAHVSPAPPWTRRCGRTCPGTSHGCTLGRGHRGPHVAHGSRRRVLAVWDVADGAVPSAPREGRATARRPIGLRERTPADLLTTVRRVGLTVASRWEEVALGTFFLAFTWFAIEWLRLIFR